MDVLSGATALFSYVDEDHDVTRYQGQAFTWIGVDELGHYPPPMFGLTFVVVSEPPTPRWKRICEHLRIRVVQVVGELKKCLLILRHRTQRSIDPDTGRA